MNVTLIISLVYNFDNPVHVLQIVLRKLMIQTLMQKVCFIIFLLFEPEFMKRSFVILRHLQKDISCQTKRTPYQDAILIF